MRPVHRGLLRPSGGFKENPEIKGIETMLLICDLLTPNFFKENPEIKGIETKFLGEVDYVHSLRKTLK